MRFWDHHKRGSIMLICICILAFAHLHLTYGDVGSRHSNNSLLRVCYYSTGDPKPSLLNGTLCTHIIKGFSVIENGTLSPGTKADIQRSIATTNLKKTYKHLKVLLSVGGGGNNTPFSNAVSSVESRKKLIYSCFDYLLKYNFDGLDIDWEFPVWNDGVPEDKENFVKFLREFWNYSQNMSIPLLLSVAVAAPHGIIDSSYNITEMSKYVNFINLMSYDYHDFTFYTPFTGHNSPLFNRTVEKAYFSTLNTAWSAVYWNKRGMPMEKILVGLPTYGHTYMLLDPSSHNVDSPSVGLGSGNGSITFSEVCHFLKSGGVRVFDNESMVPYAYKGKDWITYDDCTSLTIKSKWVKKMGFGGVMTFSLNSDDWNATCDGKTKFPLHQLIYDIITN